MMQSLPLPGGSSGAATGSELLKRVHRSQRPARIRAILLIAPLLGFLVVTFLLPLGRMLMLSVYDPTMHDLLPRFTQALKAGSDHDGLPPDAVLRAFAEDLANAHRQETAGRIANLLNVEIPGMRSVLIRTARDIGEFQPAQPRDWFVAHGAEWADPVVWRTLARLSHSFTAAHYVAALDLRYAPDGSLEAQEPETRVHRGLFARTLLIAASVTLCCMLLGYPVAYLLATAAKATSRRLMLLVLVPFWTSLLVRTTAWIVLLQAHGVVNDLLVGLGILGEGDRVRLIYNMTGSLIAMTHILLPFFILPLYSVMASIPPTYMRAAQSLGANRFAAFWKVYFPNTIPGVGSGALLVFILAIGYYITPALVGGQSGQMISNVIAFHIESSLNWGVAAALGTILLLAVLLLYWIYSRLVGLDRLRIG